MPDLTVLFWNIQNFGDGGPPHRYYPGLINTIAVVAHEVSADVIALMELKKSGVTDLPALRAALNAEFAHDAPAGNWHFDWIPAAIRNGHADHAAINDPGDLDWEKPANHEGYAVLWNANPAKLSMLEPAVQMTRGVDAPLVGPLNAPVAGLPGFALNLVLQGRPRPAGDAGYDAADYPKPSALDRNPANWPNPVNWSTLNFCFNNSNVPRRARTRRPAWCTLELAGVAAGPQALVSLMVFHAPGVIGFSQPAAVATRLCSLSRPLYQARDQHGNLRNLPRAVVGGDLNIDQVNGPAYLKFATVAYVTPLDGTPAVQVPGAGCEQLVLRDDDRRAMTTVRLARGAHGMLGAPILGNNSLDYRIFAIDNAFYRGFADAAVAIDEPVYDLVAAVAANGPFAASIQSFLNLYYQHPGALPALPAVAPAFDVPGAQVPNRVHSQQDFLTGLRQGWFPTMRSAAEFVRLMISDHLPVVFRRSF